ncbi:unnamed protein product, partial [Ectocarpus sp. 13 AM-2016]
MSPNGAFGRCLVYRIDVSDLLEKRASKTFPGALCVPPLHQASPPARPP